MFFFYLSVLASCVAYVIGWFIGFESIALCVPALISAYIAPGPLMIFAGIVWWLARLRVGWALKLFGTLINADEIEADINATTAI